MRIELDHLFICTAPGAPEADGLVRLGLLEAPPNQHAGQGTANRCFSFRNAMIELLWVSDAQDAQTEGTRRTLLWERWSGRNRTASPFGICVRPAGPTNGKPPFTGWEYRPAYLSDPLCVHIGEAGVDEPMWVYLDLLSRDLRAQHFVEHPAGLREISRLTLVSPTPLRSLASRVALENEVVSTRPGAEYLLEIEFDGRQRRQTIDFRPHLPLLFRI